MVGHAEWHGIALLSLFTRFSLIGPGMRLLTPIGALIALERATPAELRDPGHRAALANGQYILIRRDIYEATGGYAAPAMRDTFADDVHLARLVKEHGGRVAMVDGRDLVTNEQWKTWGAVWGGWRKSAYGELAPRPLFGLVTGLALLGYGVAPVAALLRAALARRPLPALLAAATVAAQIDARRFFDREFGLPLRWSLTAPAGWAAFGLLVLDTVRLALLGRGADWKGRLAPRPR
jgi:chlorobactene glucosyltransferase